MADASSVVGSFRAAAGVAAALFVLLLLLLLVLSIPSKLLLLLATEAFRFLEGSDGAAIVDAMVEAASYKNLRESRFSFFGGLC